MGCGYAVCVVLAAIGIGLLVFALDASKRRNPGGVWVAAGVGSALCVSSVALIPPMRRAVAQASARRQREELQPHEPWMWDDAWRDLQGIAQTRHNGIFYFGLAFLVLGSPGVVLFSDEWRKGNHLALLLLLFPLIGLGLMGRSARDMWRRMKFGVARFVPERLPIPLGGQLKGAIGRRPAQSPRRPFAQKTRAHRYDRAREVFARRRAPAAFPASCSKRGPGEGP